MIFSKLEKLYISFIISGILYFIMCGVGKLIATQIASLSNNMVYVYCLAIIVVAEIIFGVAIYFAQEKDKLLSIK